MGLRKLYQSCMHCIENPIYLFPEMKQCGPVPNSCIHVSVSYLYISRVVCLFDYSKLG